MCLTVHSCNICTSSAVLTLEWMMLFMNCGFPTMSALSVISHSTENANLHSERTPASSLSKPHLVSDNIKSSKHNNQSISCRIATNCITPSNNTTSPLILSALLPYWLQEILLFTPTQSRIGMVSLRMWLLHPPLRLSVHVFQNQYPQSRPCPTRNSHPTLSKTKQTNNNSCIPVHTAAQGTQVGTQKLWNHVNSLGRKNNKKHNQGFRFLESILMKQSQLSA